MILNLIENDGLVEKSKIVISGPKNGRWGRARGPPVDFWHSAQLSLNKLINFKYSFYEKKKVMTQKSKEVFFILKK